MAVLLFYISLVILGISSAFRAKVSLLPPADLPKITVRTEFPDSVPEETEALVTVPIMEKLGTVPGISELRAVSESSVSEIYAEFRSRKDLEFQILNVRDRLDSVRTVLPERADKPVILRFSSSDLPFMEISFHSEDVEHLRENILKKWKTPLEKIQGIAKARVSGGMEKRLRAGLDIQKIGSIGVPAQFLIERMKSSLRNFPSGAVSSGDRDILLRVKGEPQSVEEILDTVLYSVKAALPFRFRDAADLTEEYFKSEEESSVNGKDTVLLELFLETGSNAAEAAAAAEKQLNEILSSEKNVQMRILYNDAEYINGMKKGLLISVFSGALISFLILLSAYRSLREPLTLFLTLAVSFPVIFLLFETAGIGWNMLSLGGLLLGTGMLLDSSNISISSLIRTEKENASGDYCAVSMDRIFSSLFSSSATTVFVFFPLLFLQNRAGFMLSEMAASICISVTVSFLLSVTWTPVLYKKLHPFRISFSWPLIERLEKTVFSKYIYILRLFIKNPIQLLKYIAYAALISALCFIFLKKEFLPVLDTKELSLTVNVPSELVQERKDEIRKRTEEIIRNTVDAEFIVLKKKKGSDSFICRILLNRNRFSHTETSILHLENTLREKLEYPFQLKSSGDRLSETVLKYSNKNVFRLLSSDSSALQAAGTSVLSALRKNNDIIYISSVSAVRSPEISLIPDREKLSETGETPESVSSELKTVFSGKEKFRLRLNEEDRAFYADPSQGAVSDISSLLSYRIGREEFSVPVSSVFRTETSEKPRILTMYGNLHSFEIQAEWKSENARKEQLQNLRQSLPNTVILQENENESEKSESLNEIILSFILSYILLFLFLSGQFESFRIGMILFLSVPLLFIGSFISLFLLGESLNIGSVLGFLLLSGTAVDGAVLYYEEIQRTEGDRLRCAADVFRSVFINLLTTLCGLSPVILNILPSSEWNRSLACAVFGGLISSAGLTLILLPVYFKK